MTAHQQLLYHVVFSVKDRRPLLQDDFIGKVKANTSKHINESRDAVLKFHWQDGYGAFTVSPSNKESVIAYIENQIEHHRGQTFQEEFLLMLERHEVEYDPKYVWE